METFVLLDNDSNKIDECWSDSVMNAEQLFIKKGHVNVINNVYTEEDYMDM